MQQHISAFIGVFQTRTFVAYAQTYGLSTPLSYHLMGWTPASIEWMRGGHTYVWLSLFTSMGVMETAHTRQIKVGRTWWFWWEQSTIKCVWEEVKLTWVVGFQHAQSFVSFEGCMYFQWGERNKLMPGESTENTWMLSQECMHKWVSRREAVGVALDQRLSVICALGGPNSSLTTEGWACKILTCPIICSTGDKLLPKISGNGLFPSLN